MMKRQLGKLSGLLILLLLFLCTVTAQAEQYKVKKGDNLYSISKKLGVSVDEIKKSNALNNNKLTPGQTLTFQNKKAAKKRSITVSTSSYTVKKGDTLSIIAKKTGLSVKQLSDLNHVNTRNLRVGSKLLLSKEEPQVALKTVVEESNEDDDLLGEDEEADTPNEIACEEKATEELMGKWNNANERKLFVRVATGFLGAPYRLGGSTVRGIDCSAFVRKMYELFDIELPRTAREQSVVGIHVNRSDLVEGDLVFFRTKKPIGHVGIYIGDNKFVHASYKARSVRIDSLDQPYFQKRFQRAVRVKGLDKPDGT